MLDDPAAPRPPPPPAPRPAVALRPCAYVGIIIIIIIGGGRRWLKMRDILKWKCVRGYWVWFANTNKNDTCQPPSTPYIVNDEHIDSPCLFNHPSPIIVQNIYGPHHTPILLGGYLSVSVKVSRRIGGRKKSHAFRIQINAREMHENLLNDFVTCELVTDWLLNVWVVSWSWPTHIDWHRKVSNWICWPFSTHYLTGFHWQKKRILVGSVGFSACLVCRECW